MGGGNTEHQGAVARIDIRYKLVAPVAQTRAYVTLGGINRGRSIRREVGQGGTLSARSALRDVCVVGVHGLYHFRPLSVLTLIT